MAKLAYNENDFNAKYEKYSKLIFRTAYQYLLNYAAAEDIVQEVFIKLFTNKKAFRGEEHEKAWLLRVTVNQCKNLLASKSYKSLQLSEKINAGSSSFEKTIENKIDLERELGKLSSEQRICIFLYYYENYKMKEISKLLSLNVNTVKTILSRSRQALKKNINNKE